METVGSTSVSALSLIHLKELVYKQDYFRVGEKNSFFTPHVMLLRVIHTQMLLASALIAEQGHALCQQASPTLGAVTSEGSAPRNGQPGCKEQRALGATPCWRSAQLGSALGTVPGLLLPRSVPCQQSPSLPSAPKPAAAPGCSWEGVTLAGTPLLPHALPGVQGDGVWEM